MSETDAGAVLARLLAAFAFALVAAVLPHGTSAVQLSDFYPWSAETDTPLDRSLDDDYSSPITLSTAFPFFGTSQTVAYVSTICRAI